MDDSFEFANLILAKEALKNKAPTLVDKVCEIVMVACDFLLEGGNSWDNIGYEDAWLQAAVACAHSQDFEDKEIIKSVKDVARCQVALWIERARGAQVSAGESGGV